MSRVSAQIFSVLVLTSMMSLACQQSEPAPAEPVSTRVENADLGIAVAALPAPFVVSGADDAGWRFDAPGENGDGTLVMSTGPVETGSINLVDVVKERRAWFESTEGATYYGNRELGGPFGTIYTARGAYGGPDAEVEETWAYAIHPGDYRLLSVQYTYPPGEAQTRVVQLMEFLGEIEALGGEETAEAP